MEARFFAGRLGVWNKALFALQRREVMESKGVKFSGWGWRGGVGAAIAICVLTVAAAAMFANKDRGHSTPWYAENAAPAASAMTTSQASPAPTSAAKAEHYAQSLSKAFHNAATASCRRW